MSILDTMGAADACTPVNALQQNHATIAEHTQTELCSLPLSKMGSVVALGAQVLCCSPLSTIDEIVACMANALSIIISTATDKAFQSVPQHRMQRL
jgi:hypothetical protein